MDRHAWNERYESRELLWKADPNQFLVAALEGVEPGRALDLAAGEGRNAVWLARRGWAVTAVDFSEVGIDKGRALASRYEVTVEWIVADVLDWDPGAGRFDLVVIAYLHLGPAERAVVWAKAARAVAPGGMMLVIHHDVSNLTDGYGGPQHAEVLYTPGEVAAALAGFDVAEARKVRRTVATEYGDRQAIDGLVRAVRPAQEARS